MAAAMFGKTQAVKPVAYKTAAPVSAFGTDLSLGPRPAVNNTSIAGLQAQQNAANAANDLRYGQGLSVLNNGYNASMGSIEKAIGDTAHLGDTAKGKIGRDFTNDLGSDQQRATSRGLGNTTILNAMNDQSRRRRDDATAQVDENIASQRSNLRLQESQLSNSNAGSIASFIAARNDQGPDAGMYAQLAAQAAAAPSQQQHTTSTSLSPQFRADMAAGMSGQGGSVQQAPTVSAPTYFRMGDMYPQATQPEASQQDGSISSYVNPAQAAAVKALQAREQANKGSISITPSNGFNDTSNLPPAPGGFSWDMKNTFNGAPTLRKSNPFG